MRTNALLCLITDLVFFFWCLVQSGLLLFLKLPFFFCYSSTALAGGYSFVTLTLTLTLTLRLRVHTLRFETATCNPISSPTPTCDLCEADDDVQDEQHAIFHCTHTYRVSLRRRYESLFSEARAQDVFTFLHQNNNNIFSALIDVFYEQASTHAVTEGLFLVNLVQN